MTTKVTAQMVRECASQLQGLEFSEARSAELARDIERHAAAIAAAAPLLDFNDEPAKFAARLMAGAPQRSKRR